MKRDDLLDKLNTTINAEDLDALEDAQEELKAAVKWLERLPEGCELAGLWTDDRAIIRCCHDRAMSGRPMSRIEVEMIHPDDLTTAGGR